VGGILLLYYNQPRARTRCKEGQVTTVNKFQITLAQSRCPEK
jgi:hypothetical protein